jgi:hypothetical protein
MSPETTAMGRVETASNGVTEWGQNQRVIQVSCQDWCSLIVLHDIISIKKGSFLRN